VACLYKEAHLHLLLGVHIGAMFFTAMVCHGQLARLRPVASHLTEFYLWMSIGGVVGGFLAGIVAPLVFNAVYEYPIALLLGLLLRPWHATEGRLLAALWRRTKLEHSHPVRRASPWTLDLVLPAILLLIVAWTDENGHSTLETWAHDLGRSRALQWTLGRYAWWESTPREDFERWFIVLTLTLTIGLLSMRPLRCALATFAVLTTMAPGVLGFEAHLGERPANEAQVEHLLRARSFFGVYSVDEFAMRWGRFHILTNGTIIHGGQNMDRPLGPTTYYFREGPVGQFFDIVNGSPTPRRRMGVIGLGVGAAACYLTHGQRMTYFEIDPLDEVIARDPRYFTYLRDAGDKVDVVIGDGRLMLAKEPDGDFDVLIVAAFSGDAIPVHLLTREAFALYFRKLSERGLLLLNVTNAYIDLMPVVGNLAANAGLAARFSRGVPPTITYGGTEADWIVVARKPELLARFGYTTPPWPELAPDPGMQLWTDDFTDVFEALRWGGASAPAQ
jgi:hypothetical protein